LKHTFKKIHSSVPAVHDQTKKFYFCNLFNDTVIIPDGKESTLGQVVKDK
jgi:hypothetical protein